MDESQSKHATDSTIAKSQRNMRREIAEANYALRKHWNIPKTVFLSYQDCEQAKVEKLSSGTKVSFSGKSTADAMLYFARDPTNRICGLNFANGSRVGGGYKTGARAQEEDLCRRIPNLYTTLFNASKDGMYPFGPCTCTSPSDPAKYSDVLYTPDVVVARFGEDDMYQFLPTSQQAKVSILTAAAPNVNFASEVYDINLMYKTIKAIFIGPKYIDPHTTILVLGAWGCGAFGGVYQTTGAVSRHAGALNSA